MDPLYMYAMLILSTLFEKDREQILFYHHEDVWKCDSERYWFDVYCSETADCSISNGDSVNVRAVLVEKVRRTHQTSHQRLFQDVRRKPRLNLNDPILHFLCHFHHHLCVLPLPSLIEGTQYPLSVFVLSIYF